MNDIQRDTATQQTGKPAARLFLQVFLSRFPNDAARKLETLPVEEAASLISELSTDIRQRIWPLISATSASAILQALSKDCAIELLSAMEPSHCANLLAQLPESERNSYLDAMGAVLSEELKELLSYPENSAGKLMSAKVLSFHADSLVSDILPKLEEQAAYLRRHLFIVDNEHRLVGRVDIEQLIVAKGDQKLSEIARPITVSISSLDPAEDVGEILQKNNLEILPVIDVHHRLLGVIRGKNALNILKEEMTVDMQTMVGASREEQALSSSLFAFKKRQPWLQINLLTGFLAAAIVGLFESTIAQFTALAVLMPVAAGQSGNTGAQALAVTMRGLTLREITIRHWSKVMFKEAGAGFLNGVAIALSCGAGVYLWSDSFGLALVLAMAMIISMVIAGISGALVPMVLKKLGQDPAQSSSIILTTITDVAGFMSFLGIATALSSLLV